MEQGWLPRAQMKDGRDSGLVSEGPPGGRKALATAGEDAIMDPGHALISDCDCLDRLG